jgi:bifunctional non-homologous end joining protein LigD
LKKLKNPKKIFWQTQKINKYNLFQFYKKIGRKILPFLINRPLTIYRCPDGVEKECWVQKNAPKNLPLKIKTAILWAKSPARYLKYPIITKLDDLLWFVNQGAIEFHIWMSKIGQEKPDWIVFDIDRVKATDKDLANICFKIQFELEKENLKSYVKTTGISGFHLLSPNTKKFNYKQARDFAKKIICRVMKQNPELITLEKTKTKRKAKTFIDPAQNAKGRTIVAPYSVRATKKFSVSLPITWEDLKNFKYPKKSFKEYQKTIISQGKWF